MTTGPLTIDALRALMATMPVVARRYRMNDATYARLKAHPDVVTNHTPGVHVAGVEIRTDPLVPLGVIRVEMSDGTSTEIRLGERPAGSP